MAALLAGLLALGGCGDKSAAGGPAGQWVARVNDREITVHQVNAELNGAGAGAALPAEAAQRRAVESLVDRRLLVDAALEAKQDREPETMQAIELAREQIIAQSYLRKTMGQPPRPTPGEVGAYFDANPDLFAKRKQYEMRQIAVDTAVFDTVLKGAVDGARSLEDVEAAFAARDVRFATERAMRTGADMPPAMRAKLDTLVGGKPFVIRTNAKVLVATLSYVGEAPVSLAEATPQIEQRLLATRVRDAAMTEVARLRKQARIEYKDGYGPVQANPANPANPAGPANTVVGDAADALSSVDRAAPGLR
nr:EpsD family peptidyl-prolyl cis-trans isomerase [uncultured Massilia sp.]